MSAGKCNQFIISSLRRTETVDIVGLWLHLNLRLKNEEKRSILIGILMGFAIKSFEDV